MIKCELCGIESKSNRALSQHIRRHHKNITLKQYYDTFLRKENEGVCLTCGKETTFSRWCYAKHCSQQCGISDPTRNERIHQSSLLNHKVDHYNQSKIVQNKKVESYRKNYDVDNCSQSPVIKELKRLSYQEHYGEDHWTKTPEGKHIVEEMWRNKSEEEFRDINNKRKHSWLNHSDQQNRDIQEKTITTNLIIRNVKYSLQDPAVRELARLTSQYRYNTDWPMQDPIIQEKSKKNSLLKKKYILPSGKEILLQGEEPQFLDFVFSNTLFNEDEIDYKPARIKYISTDGKDHYYFPDFYIPKFNLIVEIKSSWILSFDIDITDLKIKATKEFGYNFIMVLDKKYDEFKNKFIESTKI